MSRRVPACAGCGLRSKDATPCKPVNLRRSQPMVIGFRAGTDDALAGEPPWARDFRHRLPMVTWLPLLRCAFGAAGALKIVMRGATNLQRRLTACHLAGLDWRSFAKRGGVFVCVGPGVFRALQIAVTGSASVKYGDVWGTYIELPVKPGLDLAVYVASDWTMPGLLSDRMLEVDITRLRAKPAREPVTPVYRVTPKEFRAALAACDWRKGPAAADIETNAFEPQQGHVRTIGVAHPSIGAIVLPAHDLDGARLHKPKAIRRAAVALADYPVIWHNSTFDTYWLLRKYGMVAGPRTLDTMLLHRHLHELAPHSLAVACSMVWYTGGWKDGLNHGLTARSMADLMRYNGADCVNTWRLYAHLYRAYTGVYGVPPYPDRWAAPDPAARVHGVTPPRIFGTVI